MIAFVICYLKNAEEKITCFVLSELWVSNVYLEHFSIDLYFIFKPWKLDRLINEAKFVRERLLSIIFDNT